jgi:cytochrome c-type biogenesis protein CcmF
MVAVAFTFAAWTALSTARALLTRVGNRSDRWAALRALPRSFVGMLVAHSGVPVFIIGVTLTSTFGVERDVRMSPGDSHELAGYRFTFASVGKHPGANYMADRGVIEVTREGKPVAILYPEKRQYPTQQQPMTEAAIDPTLTRDLYVALGEPLGDGAWAVRLYHKPFIRWIWLGALMMSLGGLIAASDRRYRILTRRDEQREPVSAPALHEEAAT